MNRSWFFSRSVKCHVYNLLMQIIVLAPVRSVAPGPETGGKTARYVAKLTVFFGSLSHNQPRPVRSPQPPQGGDGGRTSFREQHSGKPSQPGPCVSLPYTVSTTHAAFCCWESHTNQTGAERCLLKYSRLLSQFKLKKRKATSLCSEHEGGREEARGGVEAGGKNLRWLQNTVSHRPQISVPAVCITSLMLSQQ